MTEAAYARVDALPAANARPAMERARVRGQALPGGVSITIHDDLGAVERDWRAFERDADGTVFQTFAWLSTWQRCMGLGAGPSKLMPAES